MFRREDRDSDSRRHRSRFDREPSPKRSRRDAKPETERVRSMPHTNSAEHGEKRSHRLQDASSHEMPLKSDRKVEGVALNKVPNEKTYKSSDEAKLPSGPTEVPRSRSYFQHDERGSAGQGGRSSGHRATAERGWWKDSRDHATDRAVNQELQQREETSRKGDGSDNKVWRHDRFFEMEANLPPLPPPTRKRPAFREQKIAVENIQNDQNGNNEDLNPSSAGNQASNVERREERGGRRERYAERSKRLSPRGGGRPNRRDERPGGGFGPRDRNGGGGGRFGARESNNGRQPFRSGGARVEKWKHDLYDEANKSPSPKKDEERLAKIEALLAS